MARRRRSGLGTVRPFVAPSGRPSRSTTLGWAAGAAVLAAGAVAVFERLRNRTAPPPAKAPPATGRGTPSTPPSAASAAHGYETADTHVRALVLIMIVSIVLMGGGIAAVFTMYAAFARHDRASALPMTAEQQAEIVPPDPRLQADPLAEIAAFRRRQQAALTSYGPADSAREQPHIPVARAMGFLVGQPLDRDPPAAPAPDAGAAP